MKAILSFLKSGRNWTERRPVMVRSGDFAEYRRVRLSDSTMGDEAMHAMRILGLAAMMAVTAAPLAAHAEPDQKNNRGYVVGAGGVARSANTPQPDGGEPGTTVPKQTQQATFGERVNAGLQQSGNVGGQGPATEASIEACPSPATDNRTATIAPGNLPSTAQGRRGGGNLDSCLGLIR
ncbi:MAG: hypothetical protein ACK4E3_04520 [Brevundimonas sp.]|uniref:hypothetical protein n=1 Tax=Brevundimonas sp. TaxID=1871086 RepID=UPI00391A478B